MLLNGIAVQNVLKNSYRFKEWIIFIKYYLLALLINWMMDSVISWFIDWFIDLVTGLIDYKVLVLNCTFFLLLNGWIDFTQDLKAIRFLWFNFTIEHLFKTGVLVISAEDAGLRIGLFTIRNHIKYHIIKMLSCSKITIKGNLWSEFITSFYENYV